MSLNLTDFILPLKTSKKNLSVSHPTVIFVPGISEISETWAKSLEVYFFSLKKELGKSDFSVNNFFITTVLSKEHRIQ